MGIVKVVVEASAFLRFAGMVNVSIAGIGVSSFAGIVKVLKEIFII